jgi:hypothetical protein
MIIIRNKSKEQIMTQNRPSLRITDADELNFDIRTIWFALASIGNAYFAAQNFEAAKSVFSDCVYLAEVHLDDWVDADEAMNARVISGLNNVATDIARVQSDSARRSMCDTHQAVLAIARDVERSPELRLAALKQVARMLLELKRLQYALGCDAETSFWLQNSCVCLAWRQVRAQFCKDKGSARVH